MKKLNQKWYEIAVNKAGDHADIYIYSDIGYWGITANDFAKDLKEVKAKTITMHINSPGGSVFDGLAIHNVVKKHPAKVTAVVDGVAASIATVIALGADTVKMSAGSLWMIHDPSAMVGGTADDMDKAAEALRKMADSIAGIYQAKTGKALEDIKAKMSAETWFSATEAKDYGFADEIDDTVADMAACANFDFERLGYTHVPAALNRINNGADGAKETPTMKKPNEEPSATDNGAGTTKTEPATVAQATNTVDLAAVRAEAARLERERMTAIRAACKTAKIEDSFADKLVTDGVKLEDARAAIFEEMAKRQEQTETQSANPSVTVTVDARTKLVAVMALALMARANPSAKIELKDGASDFRGFSLLDMARASLEAQGIKVKGMSRGELAAKAMHSTSDFPLILADVAGKTLRQAYTESPQTFKQWTRRASAPDFKSIKRLQLGEAPSLEKVKEHGEFTEGTLTEGRETYSLATYGRIVSITRQALINDDLSAFSRIIPAMGRQAMNLECDIVCGVLTANATMADGGALFNATAVTSAGGHANLNSSSGGALSDTSLALARKAMRKQKGLDGKTYLNITPRFLLVPEDLETTVDKLLMTFAATTYSNNIPGFIKSLVPIVEPRLSAVGSGLYWYLAADPAAVDTVEYCYLEGEEGPVMDQRLGFEVDGVQFKIRHDFAAAAIDFRGLYRSNGVAA